MTTLHNRQRMRAVAPDSPSPPMGDSACADAERVGHMHGWREGLYCGIVVGAVLATLAWSVYLTLIAPEVAPPAAARPVVQVAQR